ncbi:hypothetical protein ACHAQH_002054 [Verticillium albo-atrum]
MATGNPFDDVRGTILYLEAHELAENMTDENIEQAIGLIRIANDALIRPSAMPPSSIRPRAVPVVRRFTHPVVQPTFDAVVDLVDLYSLSPRQRRATRVRYSRAERYLQSVEARLGNIRLIQECAALFEAMEDHVEVALLFNRLMEQKRRMLRSYDVLVVELPRRYQAAMVLQARWDSQHAGSQLGSSVMGIVNQILIEDLQNPAI